MQSTVTAGSQVQYSALNISAESIPIWGHCHRRIGSNVLLMDDSGGARCIRCFQLSLRSMNVLSVLTEGLDKCYTSEEAAVATCPGEPPGISPQGIGSSASTDHHSQEILLFKTSGVGGEKIQSEYCPLDDRFTFTYSTNEGSDGHAGCHKHTSEMENCPAGSGLHFRFRDCTFPDHNTTFECMGHWQGPNNQRYIALSEKSTTGKSRAIYRCALYHEDPTTGVISMAFSSDSTCSSDLRSATDGFETMRLTHQETFHWPQVLDPSPCQIHNKIFSLPLFLPFRFPRWAQGRWEHMAVEGDTLVFRDHGTFTTYTFRCLTTDDTTGERSLVFGRTQWYLFKERINSQNLRMDVFKESPCPIAGEYTGYIPDDSGLCAKLYSDCSRSEIMFYTVSDCSPEPEVYEGIQFCPYIRWMLSSYWHCIYFS
ncbi:hypothetical protein J437_LFUL016142 [Ladona fulva]|uniref:Uncharacterized protein n=1 Tax=Ladona fulva TaxID=123851 RepID=A0A8K0P6X1_LADFU|nr:hypothetical protein J437_LFUL016142 [Ladona fulva]